MKVVQVPFCFYPDPVGGTEVYVASLSRHLQERGLSVLVAAPDESERGYTHEGLPVRRFTAGRIAGPRDLYDEGDARAAEAFGHILDEERPALVHLHGITRAVSLRTVREAKRRSIPVVFSYHIGTVSCARGSLMRWGTEDCDGRLDLSLCTQCTLHGLGLPRGLAAVVGRIPALAGKGLGALPAAGKLATAARMRELVGLRHAGFHALMREVDHVVAVNDWVAGILCSNNVPREKITVSRYGFSQTLDDVATVSQSEPPGLLRVAYLGRIEPAKGPGLLVEAVRRMSASPVELHLYGIAQGEEGRAHLDHLKQLAGGDPRIVFNQPVPTAQIVNLLRSFHVLAVPSRVRETGPIVALEAFAAGTPVLGSGLGGIAELVRHEVNGLLVETGSVEGWVLAFQRLLGEGELLSRLRSGIAVPRSMRTAADEVLAIYEKVLAGGASLRTAPAGGVSPQAGNTRL